MKIKLYETSKKEVITILKRFKNNKPLTSIEAVATREDIIEAQKKYTDVHVSDDMYRYLIDVVEATRDHEHVELGVSPRGSQALLRAIQVHAILKGRDYTTPDDVKAMVKPVLGHRLILSPSIKIGRASCRERV